MCNTINNIYTSTPADIADMPTMRPNLPQTDMARNSVQVFSPDGAAGLGRAHMPMGEGEQGLAPTRHAHHATIDGGGATPQAGNATQQDAGNGNGNGTGNGMSGLVGQIMNMLQSFVSAVAPLLSMFSSMVGGMGGAGGAGGMGAIDAGGGADA